MIDGSEKRNRQLVFELRNSHVGEKRSNITLKIQRRSECLPTLHCDCVSYKMAEFSFGSRVFTVFLCDIFTGLES